MVECTFRRKKLKKSSDETEAESSIKIESGKNSKLLAADPARRRAARSGRLGEQRFV